MCEREPIIQVVVGDQAKVTYGKVTPEVARKIMKDHVVGGKIVEDHVIPAILKSYSTSKQKQRGFTGLLPMKYYRSHVLVCVDPECLKKGAHEVLDAFQDELVAQGLIDEVQVLETSRIGGCDNGPEMMVYPEGVHYPILQLMTSRFWLKSIFSKGALPKSSRNRLFPRRMKS